MHLARIKRHGYPELKKDAYQILEKLPHKFVDNFILKNYQQMHDKDIAKYLIKKGLKNITEWNVRYRRRKLEIKKYLYGEIKNTKKKIQLEQRPDIQKLKRKIKKILKSVYPYLG